MKDFDFETYLRQIRPFLQQQVKKHWFKISLSLVVLYMITRKDLTVNLKMNASQFQESNIMQFGQVTEVKAINTSMLEKSRPKPVKAVQQKKHNEAEPANTFSNMMFEESDYKSEDANSKRAIKRKKQEKYVARFYKVAQGEMNKYGIPASITLAQGLLESNAGESKLATRNNNHFGIKCFSRKCQKGHCSNFHDDSHKDFFRIYKSSWESFRAHSQLLMADRYKPLFKLDQDDYQKWAHGLKKAGYATDKNYAPKLINLIEDLQLYKYDN